MVEERPSPSPARFPGASVVDFGSTRPSLQRRLGDVHHRHLAAAAAAVSTSPSPHLRARAPRARRPVHSEGGPDLTAIAPVAGSPRGGTTVVITGTDFTGASAVSFGPTAARACRHIGATSQRHLTGLGAGTVDVTVTTPSGTSSTSRRTASATSRPAISSLSPVAGLPAGGTSVTIVGTGFIGASVLTSATPALSYTVNSATSITATSPVHLPELSMSPSPPPPARVPRARPTTSPTKPSRPLALSARSQGFSPGEQR